MVVTKIMMTKNNVIHVDFQAMPNIMFLRAWCGWIFHFVLLLVKDNYFLCKMLVKSLKED